ncbi:hypothetical protein [Paraburkholderia hospita]|uniref:Uncharacterized protein n=1 Tax=Paraburkholderia hospita TaxID=169430 RepID=A0AAJ4VWQ3_9BURK|nr:hypothetical protein [Paraburkholderia hospita]AUT76791.1 hypothetical protein C2L64_51840 [Paraburkholderia hospita]AXF06371.1 hypothetical protein CUJ88_45855 [Paraburkholderia hospita]OUL86898.1 hypothetical protein CA603_22010 [Paraburkholderia hospita]SEI26208.1 hypothetical protein SAMN05192544_106733 [Paraburkholderia hospita]
MKMTHKLHPGKAGPVWGLIFGLFMCAVGVGIWCLAPMMSRPDGVDDSLAVAAVLVGAISAVYGARELYHRRR